MYIQRHLKVCLQRHVISMTKTLAAIFNVLESFFALTLQFSALLVKNDCWVYIWSKTAYWCIPFIVVYIQTHFIIKQNDQFVQVHRECSTASDSSTATDSSLVEITNQVCLQYIMFPWTSVSFLHHNVYCIIFLAYMIHIAKDSTCFKLWSKLLYTHGIFCFVKKLFLSNDIR